MNKKLSINLQYGLAKQLLIQAKKFATDHLKIVSPVLSV